MDNLGNWIDSTGAIISDLGAGGRFFLRENQFNPALTVSLGARAETGTFTVQFFAEMAGATSNLGAAQVVAAGTPVLWPDEYSLIGNRGVDVTVGAPGSLFVEVGQ